jgi:hypothetical protein
MTEKREQSGRLNGRQSRGRKMELTEAGKMRNAHAPGTETESFEKRLRAYAAGAGAVAAGLLAFAPPVAAEIVVVPAHATIGYGHDKTFAISIEGTTPFTLKTSSFFSTIRCTNWISSNAASGAGAVAHGRSNQMAALKFGAAIGPADEFEAGGQVLASFRAMSSTFGGHSTIRGPFANTTNRFLGLKFKLNGEVYYGWAGFSSVTARGCGVEGRGVTAVLTAYAYETEPNTPIYAGQSSDADTLGEAPPQPPTLGLLALGAPGLDIWRPRKRELATE